MTCLVVSIDLIKRIAAELRINSSLAKISAKFILSSVFVYFLGLEVPLNKSVCH